MALHALNNAVGLSLRHCNHCPDLWPPVPPQSPAVFRPGPASGGAGGSTRNQDFQRKVHRGTWSREWPGPESDLVQRGTWSMWLWGWEIADSRLQIFHGLFLMGEYLNGLVLFIRDPGYTNRQLYIQDHWAQASGGPEASPLGRWDPYVTLW